MSGTMRVSRAGMAEDVARPNVQMEDTDLHVARKAAQPAGPTADVLRGADARVAAALGAPVMRQAQGDNGVAPHAEEAVARAGGSSGSPLPQELQRKFEGSLGADLSGVRVHTGSESAVAAQSVSAKAYTVGQDIHFGVGQYNPRSLDGERLLAHEIAHTVQQSNGAQRKAQFKLEVSTPQDGAEVEADRAASAMIVGSPAFVSRENVIAREVFRYHKDWPPIDQTDEIPERNWSHELKFIETNLSTMGDPWSESPVFDKYPEQFDYNRKWEEEKKEEGKNGSSRYARYDPNRFDNFLRQSLSKAIYQGAEDAFKASWVQAQEAWNGAVPAVRAYAESAKTADPAIAALSGFNGVGVGELADVANSQPLPGTNVHIRDTFDAGGDLNIRPGEPPIDSSQLQASARGELLALQGDLVVKTNAIKAITDKFQPNCRAQLMDIDIAMHQISINGKEYEQAELEQETRKLTTARSAVTGAVNGLTSLANGAAQFATGNVGAGLSAGAQGQGKLLETGVGLAFDVAINNVYAQIVQAKNQICSLKDQQQLSLVTKALAQIEGLVIQFKQDYLSALNERKKAVETLAQKMQEAAKAGGRNSDDDSEKVGAAVRSLPLVEEVVAALDRVVPLLKDGPDYNRHSGQGASLASNYSTFSYKLTWMGSIKAKLVTDQNKWQARLRTIRSLINSIH